MSGAVLVAGLLALSGCQESGTSYPPRTIPPGLFTDAGQVQQGEALFRSKCVHCHGKPSEGRSARAVFFKPAAPDFTDPHYRDIDPAYLYWRIDVGKTAEPYLSRGSVMPAWGPYFTEAQIWQLVVYLRSRTH